MDQTLRTILELAGGLLTTALGYILGRRLERAAQSVTVKASMLDTVKGWLAGVEKFVGILGDTLTSVSAGSPSPALYNMEERRKSAQLMTEHTNEVLGILRSKGLSTWRTKRDTKALAQLIENLDGSVKFELIPLDLEILDRGQNQTLDPNSSRRLALSSYK